MTTATQTQTTVRTSAQPRRGTAEGLILTLDCPSTLGIVHAVSGVLVEHGFNIMELDQFNDTRSERFFMRVHAEPGRQEYSALPQVREALVPVAESFSMRWSLKSPVERLRVLIMVSKTEHCLNDLLFRTRKGDLPIEIVAVASNHLDHQRLVEWHSIPFFHIPITKETKPQAEAELLDLVDRLDVELVVLARYMQVLSDSLADQMAGRIINIHHSFLPSFKGAQPYHQAFERGVKTVGATAHYVNSELDEGPIIAQQVIDVDHTYGPEDLIAAGRDTEAKALSQAVRWHAEGRVVLHGNKTVVLR
ncbi:formyltetrahydrofolate deformylase [Nesterenkonia sp.]|uniref:formyltetrahydrofolate deformylase n=1 Tax=Nesterenkonia sp. TaxID=704201 RepID=UPI002639DED7|nr:formyltetrahydrofolate deformylase [Nesterenkonia sp.]